MTGRMVQLGKGTKKGTTMAKTASKTHVPATKHVGDKITPRREVTFQNGKDAATVYIQAKDSLAEIMVRLDGMAEATLRAVASFTVHMIVRTYHHDDSQRAPFDVTKQEVMQAIQDYAKAKRSKPFQHAWTDRLFAAARKMALSLLSDYEKKGVVLGPIADVLRAKTASDANDVVYSYMMARTKGENAFIALERTFATNAAKAKPETGNKGGNSVKPIKGKPANIAAAVIDKAKGHEVLNAIKGNAKSKAEKIVDAVSKSNVDHLTFVLRALLMLNEEQLVQVSQAAMDRAKELHAEAKANKGKEPAKPAAAAAAAS